MEALDTENHQVFMFLKPPPFCERMDCNFSVLLISVASNEDEVPSMGRYLKILFVKIILVCVF